ncbi:MAG TPA: hypothetical protein DIC35_04885 [Candidatus Moranbacteria bacterium]|nr:hypothetical protein [Candidatus Moranbacteria bacterium]
MEKDGVEKYILDKKLSDRVDSIERMSGGIHNDVFRVDTDRGDFVYKKHCDISRTFPDIILPEGRYENEKNSYSLMAEIFEEKINPEVIYFDDENKVIVMERLEEKNRADKMIDKINPDVFGRIGKALAQIINATSEKENLRATFNGTEFQELKYEYRYYKFITNEKLFKDRDRLMEKTRKSRRAFSHGDPRLNNLFIENDNFFFIDYEGAYCADVSLDIAYLMSEILVYYFNEPQELYKKFAINLWDGFVGEIKAVEIDKSLIRNIFQHVGFALLDKIYGVIKDDYLFVHSPEKIVEKAEELIINHDIDDINKLLAV